MARGKSLGLDKESHHLHTVGDVVLVLRLSIDRQHSDSFILQGCRGIGENMWVDKDRSCRDMFRHRSVRFQLVGSIVPRS